MTILNITMRTNPEKFIIRFKEALLLDSNVFIHYSWHDCAYDVARYIFDKDKKLFKLFVEKLYHIPRQIIELCAQTDMIFETSRYSSEYAKYGKNFAVINVDSRSIKAVPTKFAYRLRWSSSYEDESYLEYFKQITEQPEEAYINKIPTFSIYHSRFGQIDANSYFCVNNKNEIFGTKKLIKKIVLLSIGLKPQKINTSFVKYLFKYKKFLREPVINVEIKNKFLEAYYYLAHGINLEKLKELLKENPVFGKIFSKFSRESCYEINLEKDNNAIQVRYDCRGLVTALIEDYKEVPKNE